MRKSRAKGAREKMEGGDFEDSIALVCQALGEGECFPFQAWPNPKARVGAGVYTIWEGERLLYVGVAGRPGRNGGGGRGLYQRLNSHAGGRRSGDQFCVYVCDRLVLGSLTPEEIAGVVAGRVSLDSRVRGYVLTRLSYRFAAVRDYPAALRVERLIKGGALRAGKPMLNPAV